MTLISETFEYKSEFYYFLKIPIIQYEILQMAYGSSCNSTHSLDVLKRDRFEKTFAKLQCWAKTKFINDTISRIGLQSVLSRAIREKKVESEIFSFLNSTYSYWNWHVDKISESATVAAIYTFYLNQTHSDVCGNNQYFSSLANSDLLISYFDNNDDQDEGLIRKFQIQSIEKFINIEKYIDYPSSISSLGFFLIRGRFLACDVFSTHAHGFQQIRQLLQNFNNQLFPSTTKQPIINNNQQSTRKSKADRKPMSRDANGKTVKSHTNSTTPNSIFNYLTKIISSKFCEII
jgi:hypothetical protein